MCVCVFATVLMKFVVGVDIDDYVVVASFLGCFFSSCVLCLIVFRMCVLALNMVVVVVCL